MSHGEVPIFFGDHVYFRNNFNAVNSYWVDPGYLNANLKDIPTFVQGMPGWEKCGLNVGQLEGRVFITDAQVAVCEKECRGHYGR